MYSVFDSFLTTRTWNSRHPSDMERFFKALSLIIDDPSFNPDSMGEYMEQSQGLNQQAEKDYWHGIVQRYVSDAWAIRGYLDYSRKLG